MVTTMRLPDELHEDLKKQAERKGMTFNAYLLSILWEVYKKDESNNNGQERG
ncbi:MAG: Arc family DNA-binding protein [bacterium]|nr:Arc family DNA-binding protein [bacterium]